jgi:hypothetical protein
MGKAQAYIGSLGGGDAAEGSAGHGDGGKSFQCGFHKYLSISGLCEGFYCFMSDNRSYDI